MRKLRYKLVLVMVREMPSDTDESIMEGRNHGELTPRESSPSQCTMWTSSLDILDDGCP